MNIGFKSVEPTLKQQHTMRGNMVRKVEQTINNNKSRFVTFKTACWPYTACHSNTCRMSKKQKNQTNIKNNPDVTFGDAPVSNSAHINLKVAVVSQQPFLHLDQIDRMVIQSQ